MPANFKFHLVDIVAVSIFFGTWFLNPWLFIVATLWVSLVLFRRAFHSILPKF